MMLHAVHFCCNDALYRKYYETNIPTYFVSTYNISYCGNINNKLCHYADDAHLVITDNSIKELAHKLELVWKL